MPCRSRWNFPVSCRLRRDSSLFHFYDTALSGMQLQEKLIVCLKLLIVQYIAESPACMGRRIVPFSGEPFATPQKM